MEKHCVASLMKVPPRSAPKLKVTFIFYDRLLLRWQHQSVRFLPPVSVHLIARRIPQLLADKPCPHLLCIVAHQSLLCVRFDLYFPFPLLWIQKSPAEVRIQSREIHWGWGHSAFIPLVIFFFLPGIKSMFILSCKIWALQSQVDGQPFPEADRSASDCVIKINAQLKCLCAIKLRTFLTRHLHRSTVWSFHF